MKKAALILSAAICALMISARAADWTDANNATYTALKSINGGGSGYIATDFKPAGTDTVKFKFKPSTVNGNDCIYCSRYFDGGYMKKQFCGFRIDSAFRVDTHDHYKSGKTTYKQQFSCDTTKPLTSGTEYTLSADYYNAVVTINGTMQTLTTSPASDKMAASSSSPFNPGSILVLLASHNSSSANAASADTLTEIGNKATCDLYYFQLWSYEGALSHNFMPAVRDSNSVTGLYDTVTQKFYPATGGTLTGAAYDASERAGKKWTGAGGDNKMSTAANWEGGVAPQAGDSLDFTIAAPFAAIVADIDATFGKIYLGAGDLPAFSGTLAATAINDLTRMQAYATATEGFTFTLEAPSGQDFTWNGGTAANWNTTDASWLYNSAASVWYEYNNAIFNTAGATATLIKDAKANSLVFNQNATVDGSETLTVPFVAVATDVSATISALTDGALTKTGAGTLTLTQNRTAATTVTEGTLTMDGATIADLTLGTDSGAPVTFDYGGQELVRNPHDYLVTGSSVTLTNGIFSTESGSDLSIRDDMSPGVLPSVLTIAKGATLRETTAANGVYICKGGNGSSTINIAGGVLEKTSGTVATLFQHKSVSGCVNINATEGGLLSFPGNVNVLCGGNIAVTSPSLYMTLSDSTFSVGGTFNFGSHYPTASNVPTTPTGVFAATNSVVSVGGDGFIVGRNKQDAKTEGCYTVDFENGVVTAKTFAVYYDRPLNNARFNGTRFVFGAAGGSIVASDGEANWFTVGNGGLTIDTQTYSAALNANLGGSGIVTKVGTGTLTVSRNQATTGGICVTEGTLAVACATFAGPVAFAAGTTLNIDNYDGHTPLSAGALELPAEGKVTLTLNGGAFPQGIYAICAATGVTAADGGKFSVTTADGLQGIWSVSDGTLLLTVDDGGISGNYWIGRAGDGKMSTAANWLNGVPAEGADIDFSGVVSDVTIIADTDRAFGTATMGEGVVTFSGALTVKGFTNTEKAEVGANSTVTIDNDVTLDDPERRLCKTIQAGGTLHITGSVNINSSTIIYALRNAAQAGAIIVDGGIAVSGNGIVWWSSKVLALGEKGISFTDNAPFLFIVDDNEVYALGERTVLGTSGRGRFRSNHDDVYLCTTQYKSDRPATITFDGNFNGVSKDDSGKANCSCWGHWRVTGCGKVVCTSAAKSNRGLRVYDGATLELNPNTATFGQSDQTFYVYNKDSETAGGTLEVASSGTVTLTGDLSLDNGAALGFNFTDRNTPPQLALSSGNLTANGEVNVKISGQVWPRAGEKVLTACGGFDAEGVTVSLAEGAPKWVKSVYVNTDGNIVLDVKPRGTRVIVR
ncbi:MAG: hypothetical protein IKL02_05120 [Kiritimatiellae bacterium]|nr:hypothetical protein [Kiritimatiellia bacterium]